MFALAASLLHALHLLGALPTLAAPPVHCTNHVYCFQQNGQIKIGRDASAGGAVVWISDETATKYQGFNLVNNYGCGRQVQMAVWDGPCWNPTQAGSADENLPSGYQSNNPVDKMVRFATSEQDTGVIYSKCTPVLFRNQGCGTPASPVVAEGHSFHMWTEMLPDSDGRAFLVKTLFVDASQEREHAGLNGMLLYGQSHAQSVIPISILNRSRYWSCDPSPGEFVATYSGLDPWLDGELTPANHQSQQRLSEHWIAMVENSGSCAGKVDSLDWGLAQLSSSQVAGVLQLNDPSCQGLECDANGQLTPLGTCRAACTPTGSPTSVLWQDHLNDCTTMSIIERFSVVTEQVAQHREARSIYYLGPIGDARNYFKEYHAPVVSGEFVDQFDTTAGTDALYRWDRNSAETTTYDDGAGHATAVRMKPSPLLTPQQCESQDLSLKGRYYADATYTFHARFESVGAFPGYHYYGLALRKLGDNHAWTTENWDEPGAGEVDLPGMLMGFYLFSVDREDDESFARVRSSENPYSAPLGSVALPTSFNPEEWHKWEIRVVGNAMRVKLDDELILECSDPASSFAAGHCSLVVGRHDSALFDDFSVVSSGDSTPAPTAWYLDASWQTQAGCGESAAMSGFRLAWAVPITFPMPPPAQWQRVVRKQGASPPANWRDGICVYEGKRMNCFDVDVEPGVQYSYRVFSIDRANNFGAGASTSVTAPP